MIKILKVLSIAVTSAAISGYFVNHSNNQKASLDLQQLQQEAGKLHSEIAQLQQKNAHLNSLVNNKKTESSINSSTSATPQHLSITEPKELQQLPIAKSADSTALTELQDERLLRKSENFGKWLTNTYKEKSTFNLREEMQQRFDSEVVDPDWAEVQEREYLALFDNHPELAGLALRETQCRSQQCALTVSISDTNQANALVDKMTAALKQKNTYPMIIATPDEQSGVTTLYIGKDANSFEFN